MKNSSKKKLVLVVLCIALCVVFTACGSSGEQEASSDGSSTGSSNNASSSEPKVEIVDKGYSTSQSDDYVYVNWGAVVKNKSNKFAYASAIITITAYDKEKNVISTDDEYIATIQPGDKQSYGGQMECNGQLPDTVSFKIDTGESVDASSGAVKSSNLEISGISERKLEYQETVYAGNVKNNNKNKCDSAVITILLKKDDKIVYGTNTFVHNIEAGKSKAFDESEFDVPDYDKYVISAYSD